MGLLIATYIREVGVILRRDKEAKVQACKADKDKGILNLLGNNLIYLLHLGQLSAHEDLPLMWKYLAGLPKCQHLATLQRALDNTARHISVCAPIIETTGLLKLTLALIFSLDHRDNLGTGLHQFGLVNHTSAARKVLKFHAN